MLEQLIYNKVIHHTSSLFTPKQFGFFKNRSTIQQLLVIFDIIMGSDHQTELIYFDFKKGFDSVSQNELLNLFASLEICGYGLNHICLIVSTVWK